MCAQQASQAATDQPHPSHTQHACSCHVPLAWGMRGLPCSASKASIIRPALLSCSPASSTATCMQGGRPGGWVHGLQSRITAARDRCKHATPTLAATGSWAVQASPACCRSSARIAASCSAIGSASSLLLLSSSRRAAASAVLQSSEDGMHVPGSHSGASRSSASNWPPLLRITAVTSDSGLAVPAARCAFVRRRPQAARRVDGHIAAYSRSAAAWLSLAACASATAR